MDRTADPCVDFYQYSCGGWRSRNPIPPDQANWSVYGKLYQDNQRFLWGILENLAHTTTGRSESQQKIGDYFAACMDESAIEQLGIRPLAPLLTRIANLRSKRELPGLLADLQPQTRDSGFLFGFGSNQDYADSTQIIAFAEAGGLGLPDRDYYTDTDAHAAQLRTQYKQHLARMFELLGDSPAAAARNATVVLRLETKLAQAEKARGEHRVEDGARHEFVVLAQQAQVVIGAMHDQFVAGQRLKHWVEIEAGQRVNEPVAGNRADLNQADLLRISMQAVSLRIHGHPGGSPENRQEGLHLSFGVNHPGNIFASRERAIAKFCL
jgi:predicted metalloendopeptidase